MTYVEVPVKYRNTYVLNGLPLFWKWCEDTFGPPDNSAYGKPATEFNWGLNPGAGYTMYFKNPEHATMFALKWT